MTRVSDILGRKGAHVHSISGSAFVYDAIERMIEHNIGALIVEQAGEVAGIFTERDHLRRVTLGGKDPRVTRVRDVMTARLVCVEPGTPVGDCMTLMTRERIRHLPVMEGPEIVGVVSIGDLVKHLATEREVEIRYLTEYITGSPSVF